MIIQKTRYGQLYDYDDSKKLFYNPVSKKWIKKIRPSTKGKNKGKSISTIENTEHYYYDFQLSQLSFQSKPSVHFSPDQIERINFFLSKVERKYQMMNWFENNDETNIGSKLKKMNYGKSDEAVVYFSTREMNYLLTAKKRNDIIQILVENDLVKLIRKEKKYHYVDNRTITFINPKILWFFTPTKKLLSREKKMKTITYRKVNNSVNSYYELLEEKLGYYAEFYRKQYKCKFHITRDEFNQVIKSKYNSKQRKCSYDEYVIGSNYLYETIMEWNLGTKYSNLSSYKIDSFSGRVHSIFSMLSKDFFKFNDTFNLEIDLATSQPLMLAHLLKQDIGENQFSTDVDNGVDIYEKIKDHYSLPDRDAGKQMFYELIFGYNSSLDELYPEANQWIAKKKKFNLYTYRFETDTPEYRLMKFYNKKGESIKRHSIIALMLQELELKIFKRIWDTLITVEIAFVTRHDSVVINADDLENAKYHINNILEEELCLKGRLKTTKFL